MVFVTNVAIRLINIETDSSPKIHKNHNLKQKTLILANVTNDSYIMVYPQDLIHLP